MKKATVIIVILLGVGVLIYYANENINIFNKVSIDNTSKFCYPNSQIEEGKIFFVVDMSITNESNRNIKFKVKILPKDKELIKLIGEERQLTKESQNSSTDIYEIEANTTQSIFGILETEIPESELDKITKGFKDFDILLYNDNFEKLYN